MTRKKHFSDRVAREILFKTRAFLKAQCAEFDLQPDGFVIAFHAVDMGYLAQGGSRFLSSAAKAVNDAAEAEEAKGNIDSD